MVYSMGTLVSSYETNSQSDAERMYKDIFKAIGRTPRLVINGQAIPIHRSDKLMRFEGLKKKTKGGGT